MQHCGEAQGHIRKQPTPARVRDDESGETDEDSLDEIDDACESIYPKVPAPKCQNCPNPGCQKMKGLLQHAAICITHEIGGCFECKRIWYLFKLHATVSVVSQCHAPHCRGLKERVRRKKE
ncbi:hypothetical protein ACET3Z_021229 [Daucus carota]